MKVMRLGEQMSDRIRLIVLLSISGGFMDVYSYIQRGEVFANAQTGNIIFFGIRIAQGNFKDTIKYLIPISSFIIGIAMVEIIRKNEIRGIHWRQTSVLCEAIILTAVAFIPLSNNLIANSLISLVCGIQIESFRKVHGKVITTTMCMGNMRSGVEEICDFYYTKKKDHLYRGLICFLIIGTFILGAIIGNFIVGIFKAKSILLCSLVLLVTFVMMFDKKSEVTNKNHISMKQ